MVLEVLAAARVTDKVIETTMGVAAIEKVQQLEALASKPRFSLLSQ